MALRKPGCRHKEDLQWSARCRCSWAVATALPPYVIEQDEVARLAPIVFGATLERHPGLVEVFFHTGIERRHLARPLDWFAQTRDWSARTQAYLDAAELFAAAVDAALGRAGLAARDVDVVVTVSSTGIATPSLEARVARRLGLRAGVARVPVFGLGCAGGVTGLGLAARLARAEPGQVVLLVAVELCTLAFRFDRVSKTDVVATACYSATARPPRCCATTVGIPAWPAWDTAPSTPGPTRSTSWAGPSIRPASAWCCRARCRASSSSGWRRRRALHRWARACGVTPHLICHLGSTKVLAAIETALQLAAGTLADEREVLRGHGNMSAPSVLFVLERALARGLKGPAVLAALGPGFTASFLGAELGHG